MNTFPLAPELLRAFPVGGLNLLVAIASTIAAQHGSGEARRLCRELAANEEFWAFVQRRFDGPALNGHGGKGLLGDRIEPVSAGPGRPDLSLLDQDERNGDGITPVGEDGACRRASEASEGEAAPASDELLAQEPTVTRHEADEAIASVLDHGERGDPELAPKPVQSRGRGKGRARSNGVRRQREK